MGGRGGFVVVVTQGRREGLFQVPAEVAGQHPQEHAGTHPVEQPAPVTKPSGDPDSMLRTRQRYQPAEKLAMVEYLPLGGDNITTRGIYRRPG